MSDTCKEECTFTRWQRFFKLQLINLEASKIITNQRERSVYILRTSTVGFPRESKISRARTLWTEDMAKVDEDAPIPKGVAFNGLEGENAEPVIFFQKEVKGQKMRTNRSLLSPPKKKCPPIIGGKVFPSYRIVELTWSKEKRKYCRSEFNHFEMTGVTTWRVEVYELISRFKRNDRRVATTNYNGEEIIVDVREKILASTYFMDFKKETCI